MEVSDQNLNFTLVTELTNLYKDVYHEHKYIAQFENTLGQI